MLASEGKFNEATEVFRDCLTIYPANLVATNNLAVCAMYMQINKYIYIYLDTRTIFREFTIALRIH